MQQSDHIVVIDQCGILRQGSYATVTGKESFARRASDASGPSDEPPEQPQAAANSISDAAASKEKETKQQIDDLVQSQGDTSLYWYYFKSIGWKYGLTGLLLATSTEVFSIMGSMFTQSLYVDTVMHF